MESCWNRLKLWMINNYPVLHDGLNIGATEEEISVVEAEFGIRLPDDYKRFISIHNGENRDSIGLFGNYLFLPIQEVLNQWRVWQELSDEGMFEKESCSVNGPIRSDQWMRRKWIPITHNGSGDHHCLDLDPDENGLIGQVIATWHDDNKRELIADNFTSWIETIASRLEAGDFSIIEEEEDVVIPELQDLFGDEKHYVFNNYGFMK